jgi:integrase
MPRSRLTELGIEKLAPKKTLIEYWDKTLPGFGVRVMPSGFKSFFVMFRLGTVQRRLSLGRADPEKLAATRKQAKEILDGAKKGRDPSVAIEEKRANTFAKLAEDYIREHVRPTRKDAREVEAVIRKELIPIWGNRAIADISRREAAALIKTIKLRGGERKPGQKKRKSGGPSGARHAFAAGSHMFNWAIGQEAYGIEASPFDRLKKKILIGEPVTRDRVLSDSELKAVWQASQAMPFPYGDIIRMLALSGQRLRDISEMSWSEVDFAKKLIVIPPTRMKMDAAHVVPMSPPMVELMQAMPHGDRGDFVFSVKSARGARAASGWSAAKEQLDAKVAEIVGAAIPNWVFHDLRRTFRTALSELRVVDRVSELCIAHKTQGMHKVYDQYKFLDERREAMDLWAAKLAAIISPPPANVVTLTARKA